MAATTEINKLFVGSTYFWKKQNNGGIELSWVQKVKTRSIGSNQCKAHSKGRLFGTLFQQKKRLVHLRTWIPVIPVVEKEFEDLRSSKGADGEEENHEKENAEYSFLCRLIRRILKEDSKTIVVEGW